MSMSVGCACSPGQRKKARPGAATATAHFWRRGKAPGCIHSLGMPAAHSEPFWCSRIKTSNFVS